MGVLGDLIFGGLSLAGSIYSSERNIGLTRETNALNEQLTRESWAREDNAVQRRVADLKAAGLSPTLAAGSAAATSGAIRAESPRSSDYGQALNNAIQAYTAVQQIKGLKLDNEYKAMSLKLLQKNIDYYGYPDWAVAAINMLGLDKFKQMFQSFGDNLFNMLGLGSSGAVSDSGSSLYPDMSNIDPNYQFMSKVWDQPIGKEKLKLLGAGSVVGGENTTPRQFFKDCLNRYLDGKWSQDLLQSVWEKACDVFGIDYESTLKFAENYRR